MSTDEINRAIAEHLGWEWYAVEKGSFYYRQGGCGYTSRIAEAGRYTKEQAENELVRGEPMRIVQIPYQNYASDLNAMHEAEKVLTPLEFEVYRWILWGLCKQPQVTEWSRSYLSAVASQRAEAFLKAIGKWRDS